MRVLRVAGSNLNSLRRFDLRFDAAPLANSGIVAITGPTGAGKSTLLDALCLGLYGTTPRLAQSTGKIISQGRLAAEAQVEFEVGGRRYRSQWSRNLSKAGRLQPARMDLIDPLTEQSLCTGLTTVRERVTELVGLGDEEFRRAVLLAQGDFDAFLAADQSTRTRLLERLTGSSLYRTLSRAAFDRAPPGRAGGQGRRHPPRRDRAAVRRGHRGAEGRRVGPLPTPGRSRRHPR